MKYIEFDQSRPMDLILLGRVAIDFNPAYNNLVKEEFKPLKKVHIFEKYVGGSPANIAVSDVYKRQALRQVLSEKFPMISSGNLWWTILTSRELTHRIFLFVQVGKNWD